MAEEHRSTDHLDDESKGMPLHTRILIGLGAGVAAGVISNFAFGGESPQIAWIVCNITEPIGELFLRLLLMIVVPLVFSSLVVGVAGVGDIRKIGRVGLKSFVYTFVISAISVVIGISLANTIKPGKRINPETAQKLSERYGSDAVKRVEDTNKNVGGSDSPLMQVVKTAVPKNPIAAVAGETPNMLHLMFFALVVGIALTLVPEETAAPLIKGLQSLYEVTAKIIELIMRIAPYA